MRRLILLRHAKSAWDVSGLPDHDRVLNKRGRRSCDAIGRWLAERGYLPDQVLCSTSARTLETWERVAAALPEAPQPALLSKLYLADAATLIEAVTAARGDCLAVLAHNPGIAEAAHLLAENPPTRREFARYPTLSTLVLDFEVEDWTEIPGTRGRTVDFTVPRDFIG